MRVLTLATIETPRGEVPAGKIIIIPDEVFDLLRGKVETVPVLHSPADTLFRGAVEIITPQGARVWIATTPEATKLIPPGAVNQSFLPISGASAVIYTRTLRIRVEKRLLPTIRWLSFWIWTQLTDTHFAWGLQ